MKRHNAADLPPPASSGRQEKPDKLEKGNGRCSRLCMLLTFFTTVFMLARHCYDAGLAAGATGAVVRVEHSPPSSLHITRKIDPTSRGRSSFSARSTSPADNGEKALSNPSASAHSGGKPLLKPSLSAPDSDLRGDPSFARAFAAADDKGDLCGGRYIYVQELPPRFNTDMVRHCRTLSPWTDKCKYTANGGFGQQLSGGEGALQETGWYDSDEHMLDVIFHDRIRRYECLTSDSSLAAAVFVPFYAGLDVARHLWGYNVSARDALALEMVDLVTARPEWRAMGGRDHFFVAGRTTWDFRRRVDGDPEWGSKLFRLPAVQNMTALVLEASPWHLNDAAVPRPTAFHPATDEGVFFWQDRMRALERPWLFSFAGAPSDGGDKSITSNLVEQCTASAACSLMECRKGQQNNTCDSPASVIKLFQSSTFCLQPRGHTYTSKRAFEAMLAGCIPVFFHPGTAYVQYTWHLPRNHTEYSVYISEEDVRRNASVEERLRQIPQDDVERMRDAVVGLIPAVIYTDPSSKLESTVEDAFDVAVRAVTDKVTNLRKGIVEGRKEDEKLEMYSWKYPLLGQGQKAENPHEWDQLFAFN